MDGRHAMLAEPLCVRRSGWRLRQIRQRGMLRIHEYREESQIIADRRIRSELTQPRRTPRKYEPAIRQANTGYRRLSEGFDLSGFEDSLRHGGQP